MENLLKKFLRFSRRIDKQENEDLPVHGSEELKINDDVHADSDSGLSDIPDITPIFRPTS